MLSTSKMLRITALFFALGCAPAYAQVAESALPDAQEMPDPVALIREAAERLRPTFQVTRQQAVSQFDFSLGARTDPGRSLWREKEPQLLTLYADVAEITQNTGIIAGDALIKLIRKRAGGQLSKSGEIVHDAVVRMFEPADQELVDRGIYMDINPLRRRTIKAIEILSPLQRGDKPGLAFYAQLCVIGGIWGDEIAVAAGDEGLRQLPPTPEQMAIINQAKEAVRAMAISRANSPALPASM